VPPEPGRRLARSAGLAGIATLTSRLLGLARDQILAALFGAGDQMDAFLVAFRIPNLVRDLFAEGAMSAAFVPTFTRHLTQRGRADAWRLANNLLNALILVTGALVVVGMIFAGPLVTLYARSYGDVPGKLELTIQLTRVMLPFLALVAVAAALMGMLNALHRFFLPAIAPASFNVATIACAVGLVPLMPRLGQPAIVAIAAGALLGGAAQVAVQWKPLRDEGFRYRPVLSPGDPALRRILLMMGPGMLGLAATQLNLFVNTLLATGAGTGAVSWLTYAFRLIYLPIGLFGVSIATAVLPAASRDAAREDREALRHTVSRGIGLMLILNVPASVGLMVLATPIVRLLFERGQFSPSDTIATAAALQFYAVGLVGYSAARIAAPVFYALGTSRVAVATSVASVAINIAGSLLLVPRLGFLGLALATSIAALAHGAATLLLLRRRLGGMDGGRLAGLLAKITAATAAMAVAALAIERVAWAVWPDAAVAVQAMRLALAIGGGLAALAGTARLLRIPEFDDAWALVREKASRLRSS
jgi:putative peptidoglycan lipid II flippase